MLAAAGGHAVPVAVVLMAVVLLAYLVVVYEHLGEQADCQPVLVVPLHVVVAAAAAAAVEHLYLIAGCFEMQVNLVVAAAAVGIHQCLTHLL